MGLDESRIEETPQGWDCQHCSQSNALGAKFCTRCGKPRFTFSSEFGKKSVYSVLALYFLLLIAILIIYLAEPGGSGWMGQFYGSLILAIITLVFVGIDFADFKKYIFPQRIKGKLLLGIIFLTPVFSFLVSNSVTWVNIRLFDQNPVFNDSFFDAPHPLLFAILFNAFFPAFFEELAFRGVVFSRGRGVFSLKQTIVVSSVLFTFLHLSLLSFVWIFPFSLALGWLRARYRTVFYSMIMHLLHNFTAVILEHRGWDLFLVS